MRNVKFLLLPAMLLLAGSAMAAAVTSVSPNQGNASGGGTIIIRGNGFPGGATAHVLITVTGTGQTFDVLNGSLTLNTATRVSFVLPASPGGTGAATFDIRNAGVSVAVGNFTYSNNQLLINAKATIASIVSIKWGSNTVADSANTAQAGQTTPYSWVIGSTSNADAATATLSLGTAYRMSDDYVVTIENASSTGNGVDVFARASNTANWSVGGAAAQNVFRMTATVNIGGTNSNAVDLTTADQELKNGGADFPIPTGGANQAQFDLNFTSPTSITAGADVAQTSTITITGLKD